MTGDDRFEGGYELVEAFAVIEGEQEGREIGIALASHEMLEDDTFLQWREGIEILYVCGAARNCFYNLVDLLLA